MSPVSGHDEGHDEARVADVSGRLRMDATQETTDRLAQWHIGSREQGYRWFWNSRVMGLYTEEE